MADVTDGVQSEVAGLFGRDGLYMLMWAVQIAATALFTPINTRLLGAGGYGRVTIAVSVMMLVFSFANLALANGIQRVFADDGGPEKGRRLVAASIGIAVAVTAVADLSGPYWSNAVGFGGYGGAIHYGVIMAGVSSVTSVCLGYLRSQDRLGAFSAISLLQTVVAEALSVGLVLSVTHHTAGVYMMGQLLAQIAATVAGLVLVRPLMFRRRDTAVLKRALSYCLPLVPGGLATFILTAGDRFILQRQLGSVAVGRYQVAYNLGGMAIILLGVLNMVWMPRLFAITDRMTQSTVLVEARDNIYRLLTPVLLGLSVAGPVLLHFWVPPSYHPSRLGLVLVVVAISALPFAGYQAHSRVLMISGNTLAMAWTMVVAAVLNIILNFALIPPMGITGSALATFVSYLVLSSLVRVRADRIIKLEPIRIRLGVVTVVGAGLALLSTKAPVTPGWLGVRFVFGLACAVVLVLQLRGVITGRRFQMIPALPVIARRFKRVGASSSASEESPPATPSPGTRRRPPGLIVPRAPRRSGSVAEGPPTPLGVRAVVAVGAIVAGLVAEFAGASGFQPLQAVGVVVIAFFGIGMAVVQFSKLDVAGYFAVGLASSLLVMILGSWVMIELGWWHPEWAFAAVTTVALIAHLQVLRQWVAGRARGGAVGAEVVRAGADGSVLGAVDEAPAFLSSFRPLGVRVSPSLVLSVSGCVFWVSAALVSRHIVPGPGGFLTQVFPTWYLGPVCFLVALLVARRDREYEAALAVILLALCFAVTVEVVYDGLRAPTASLHVAVIQELRASQRVNSNLDIYNAWPGFFSMIAWICDAGKIVNPFVIARWWPALMALFTLAEFRYLAGKILGSGYRCWVAALLAVLADTIGADYFSPQSVGFVLALAIYAVAIGHQSESVVRTRFRLTLVFALGVALAVTHQLSPAMVAATLVVLVVFGLARPWWMPALVIVPGLGWALLNWHWVSSFVSLRDVGQVGNFVPPEQGGLAGLTRNPIIRITEFALLIGLLIVTVAAVVWFLRRRRRATWGLAFCCVAPLSTVAANAYGNEGIYRAIVFAVPWMALMACGIYLKHRWTFAGAGVALLATYLVGTYGMDAVAVMAPADLAAATYYNNHAEVGSLVLTGGEFTELPVSASLEAPLDNRTSWAQLDKASPRLIAGSDPSLTVAKMSLRLARHYDLGIHRVWYWISPVGIEYDSIYALETPAQQARLNTAIEHSGYWAVRYSRQATILLQMTAWPTVHWEGYSYRVISAAPGQTVATMAASIYGPSKHAIAEFARYNPDLGTNPKKLIGRLLVVWPTSLSQKAPVLPKALLR